jgi:4-amino-4-deoxy-L-arabinose transferase-like glycosyltransferase
MLRLVAPVLAFAAPIIVWDLGWRLPAPATAWDALTYHLYMPARWLLEGRLVHVPTVFGDPAAAFAPQNGALLFAWWLGLFGGDAITNVVNTLAACLFAAALARLARQCGAPREAAGLAAIGVFWIAPMRASIYVSLVDMLMLAFWAASLSFTVQALDRSRPAVWLAGGLSTGLAIGTKLVGAVLLGPQVLLFAIVLCVRRQPRALAGYVAAVVAGGGWWYLFNFVRYGNPLFPVDLKLGPWTLLSGAIPYDTFAGQFYVPIGNIPETLLWHYGAMASAVTIVGASILLASATISGPHRAARRLVAGVGLYWGAYYAFSLPHNTQTRFFLPVVALALVGWAMALGGIQRRKRWAPRLTWAVILLLLCLDIEFEPWWRSTQPSPLVAGMPLRLWLPLGLATVASIVGALFARRLGRRRLLQGVAILGVLVSIGFAQSFATTRRDFYGANTSFASRLAAAHALAQADPLATGRVGYTGFNLPYTLMGPHQTRFVRYVNIQGRLEDGFYDFWREEAQLATRPKPAFYRGRGHYDTWLANLEAAEIEWVVVFQLADSERYIPADAEGFPIERQWAEMNPSRFELTASGRGFRLFRLLQCSAGNRQQHRDAILVAPVEEIHSG